MHSVHHLWASDSRRVPGPGARVMFGFDHEERALFVQCKQSTAGTKPSTQSVEACIDENMVRDGCMMDK